MPATEGFQLVDTDLALLQYVHNLRLATSIHLADLCGRSYKRTQERLAKLHTRGYLGCITHRPHKYVYTIGREGIAALVEHGYMSQEITERRLRQHEIKELGIRHAVFIADIHVRLTLLARKHAMTIASWVEGPLLWDRVTTSANEIIPIRPDALFSIETGSGRAHFFLEADRGTMAHSRMRSKVKGYQAYFHQRSYKHKYPDMELFRVATITETRGRAQSLLTEFRELMPASWSAAYPVLALQDLNNIDVLIPELRQAHTT